MTRIGTKFAELKKNSEGALVCFINSGDPDLKTTEDLALAIEDAGADILELGVPFSDPLMDGPVIQMSSQRALKNGVSLIKILESVAKIRERSQMPIVLMSCTNPIYQFGMKKFAKSAVSAGVDGIILTDMPPEESIEWKPAASENNLDTIFLVAPTSTDERLQLVAKESSGFIYCVSRAGITGVQKDIPEDIAGLPSKLKSLTQTPAAVGFGISTPEHVQRICSFADGAVVGSAIVNIISEKAGSPDLILTVKKYVSELKAATRNG